jgi:hypothetical protein
MSWQGTDVRTFARQRVLFCHCGQSMLYAAGKCLRCYSRDKRNERHYAGLREVVLTIGSGFEFRFFEAEEVNMPTRVTSDDQF